MRNRFLLAFFLEVVFQTTNLLALQTYPLLDQQQTTVQVSKSELNRIAVSGDRIQQIFGAEEKFDVQSDETSGQIFVRLLDVRHNKPTTLTLITESGVTHDLTLVFADLPFQSILLKPFAPHNADKPVSHTTQFETLSRLMQAMRAGKTHEEYTLSKLSVSDRSYPEPIKITPQVLYRGDSLEGRLYILENTGDVTTSLSEKSLALPQDQALSLSTNHLKPGERCNLFVISKSRRPA